jgi:hypothetical protein
VPPYAQKEPWLGEVNVGGAQRALQQPTGRAMRAGLILRVRGRMHCAERRGDDFG